MMVKALGSVRWMFRRRRAALALGMTVMKTVLFCCECAPVAGISVAPALIRVRTISRMACGWSVMMVTDFTSPNPVRTMSMALDVAMMQSMASMAASAPKKAMVQMMMVPSKRRMALATERSVYLWRIRARTENPPVVALEAKVSPRPIPMMRPPKIEARMGCSQGTAGKNFAA